MLLLCLHFVVPKFRIGLAVLVLAYHVQPEGHDWQASSEIISHFSMNFPYSETGKLHTIALLSPAGDSDLKWAKNVNSSITKGAPIALQSSSRQISYTLELRRCMFVSTI